MDAQETPAPDPDSATPAGSGSDRRAMPRFGSRSTARVLRDTDAMRLGVPGKLVNLSPAGLGLTLSVPLAVGEHVKVELANDLQRFKKEVRGVVRHCSEARSGGYRIGMELFTRMSPRDLSMLRLPFDSGDKQII